VCASQGSHLQLQCSHAGQGMDDACQGMAASGDDMQDTGWCTKITDMIAGLCGLTRHAALAGLRPTC
jgi:hypothetical protein